MDSYWTSALVAYTEVAGRRGERRARCFGALPWEELCVCIILYHKEQAFGGVKGWEMANKEIRLHTESHF